MERRTARASIQVFQKDNVFCMINGQLQECKLLKTIFVKSSDGIYEATTIVRLPNGVIDQEHVAYDTAFDSIDDYEKNKCAETQGYDLWLYIRPHIFFTRDYVGERRKTNKTYYTFENGEPQSHELELDTFYYIYPANTWGTDELPDTQIYATKNDAISYNVTEVVNMKGIKTKRVGINKLIQLDDDQQELVHQLEELVTKLKENDILLLADTADNYMAYNMRNVKGYNMGYDGFADVSDEEKPKYEVADRWGKSFKVNVDIPQWSEDYGIFFKTKE